MTGASSAADVGCWLCAQRQKPKRRNTERERRRQTRQSNQWLGPGACWTGRLAAHSQCYRDGPFFNVFDPPISPGRHGLEIACFAGFVAKHPTQLRDHARQGVIGDGGVGPQRLEDLLLAEQVSGPLDHQDQQVEGLGLKGQRDAGALEAIAVEIEDEVFPAVTRCH